MLKVAFLDRDGVINIDYGHVYKKDNFVFIEGVVDAMKLLDANQYKIIIVTNQAGIAKGLYSEKDYNNLTAWYLKFLKEKGIEVLDTFFCPYHVDSKIKKYKKDSFNRKPNPGMFLEAMEKYAIDKVNSFTVGDKLSDIEASKKSGIKNNYLVDGGLTKYIDHQDINIVTSLKEAVERVLSK
tara:strand:- start:42 stop:587 length:546 start_codon:yes stop_codon:yes gene_type:complete